MNAIVISPARDGRIWAGGEGAIFNGLILLSEDWGDNWEPVIITPGFENAVFDLAVDQNDPRRLWAGVRGGVMRSEDYGRTWEYVLTRISGDNGGTIANVLTLGADVYAVGSAFRPIPDTWRDLALFRSGDGGTTWTAVPAPPNITGANVAVRVPTVICCSAPGRNCPVACGDSSRDHERVCHKFHATQRLWHGALR